MTELLPQKVYVCPLNHMHSLAYNNDVDLYIIVFDIHTGHLILSHNTRRSALYAWYIACSNANLGDNSFIAQSNLLLSFPLRLYSRKPKQVCNHFKINPPKSKETLIGKYTDTWAQFFFSF